MQSENKASDTVYRHLIQQLIGMICACYVMSCSGGGSQVGAVLSSADDNRDELLQV